MVTQILSFCLDFFSNGVAFFKKCPSKQGSNMPYYAICHKPAQIQMKNKTVSGELKPMEGSHFKAVLRRTALLKYASTE